MTGARGHRINGVCRQHRKIQRLQVLANAIPSLAVKEGSKAKTAPGNHVVDAAAPMVVCVDRTDSHGLALDVKIDVLARFNRNELETVLVKVRDVLPCALR